MWHEKKKKRPHQLCDMVMIMIYNDIFHHTVDVDGCGGSGMWYHSDGGGGGVPQNGIRYVVVCG